MCKICKANTDRFTADDARDASEAGDPITVDRFVAHYIVVDDHGSDWDEFVEDMGDYDRYDAWAVLAWLGY